MPNTEKRTDLQVRHYLDANIGEFQDADIRYLLSLCFGEDFSESRYAKEVPAHRWLAYDDGLLVGHLAAHEKELYDNCSGPDGELRRLDDNLSYNLFKVAGISEVCVNPDYRIRGITKSLLSVAHEFLTENQFDFALLFGNEQIFKSSGYELKTIDYSENNRVIPITVLVRSLACSDFPASSYLPGPRF